MFNKKLISVMFTLSILIFFAIYAEQANAQRVHLLTMYDSVTSISKGCAEDVESVKRLLFDWQNKSVTSLTTQARSQGLLAKINSMPVGPNDVLFFFYAGHGECDGNKDHFLTISYAKNQNDRLSRKELRAALLAKKARLTIIVTDCCASYVGGASPLATCAPMIGNILQRLFSFSGLVDINSSSFGESAWGSTDWFRDHDSPSSSFEPNGEYGLFTRAFCNALLFKDGGYNNWNDFAGDLRTNMVSDFRNFKDERRQSLSYPAGDPRKIGARDWASLQNQSSQTPWFFSLPGGPPPPPIIIREHGVRVVLIQADSTASRLTDSNGNMVGLNLNDIILSINGRTLRNHIEDYNNAIDTIGRNGQISLVVLDARTGRQKTLYGQLDYSTRARFGVGIRND